MVTSALLLFAVGCVAGTLNVLAGGGSTLTLPALIFLGLPPTVANGTNRVAILVQNVGAVWGFHKHRVLPWQWAVWTVVPAVLGSLTGAHFATMITDAALQRLIAGVMFAVALWTIWDPLRSKTLDEVRLPESWGVRLGLVVVFFGIGVYGGFIQAGVGFLLLAATTWIGFDLVRGNALKVLVVLAFTIPALVVFGRSGLVDWGLGAVLAAGNLTGGLLGVRLNVLKGHKWVKGFVLAAVLVMATRLLVTGG